MNSNFRRIPAIGLLALLLVNPFTGCKKDKDNTDPGIPVLGTCKPVPVSGRLTQGATAGQYTFTTSGGGKIAIDPTDGIVGNIVITHNTYPGFRLELWGELTVNGQKKSAANHENLGGKHIKDRLGNNRTIIFPDGAKMTIVSEGAYQQMLSISIYDRAEAHHINLVCNTVEYSGNDADIASALDAAQADGETSAIEFTSTGLLFVTLYQEDAPGNKVNNRYNLGEIFRADPGRVNDYFDDPRLGAT